MRYGLLMHLVVAVAAVALGSTALGHKVDCTGKSEIKHKAKCKTKGGGHCEQYTEFVDGAADQGGPYRVPCVWHQDKKSCTASNKDKCETKADKTASTTGKGVEHLKDDAWGDSSTGQPF